MLVRYCTTKFVNNFDVVQVQFTSSELRFTDQIIIILYIYYTLNRGITYFLSIIGYINVSDHETDFKLIFDLFKQTFTVICGYSLI